MFLGQASSDVNREFCEPYALESECKQGAVSCTASRVTSAGKNHLPSLHTHVARGPLFAPPALLFCFSGSSVDLAVPVLFLSSARAPLTPQSASPTRLDIVVSSQLARADVCLQSKKRCHDSTAGRSGLAWALDLRHDYPNDGEVSLYVHLKRLKIESILPTHCGALSSEVRPNHVPT